MPSSQPGCTAWLFKLPSRFGVSVILTLNHPGASSFRTARALLGDSPWPILLAAELTVSVQPQEPPLLNHAVSDPVPFSAWNVPPLPSG